MVKRRQCSIKYLTSNQFKSPVNCGAFLRNSLLTFVTNWAKSSHHMAIPELTNALY